MDPPRPPLDGLIVLGARVNPQGEPGRVARLRLIHALNLWRTCYPECLIFITGGLKPGAPVSEAESMARWSGDWAAAQWGAEVAESLAGRLILEEASHNTAASARNLLPQAKMRQLRSLGVVTDALHLPRAHFLFRRQFARHGITIHPLPVPGVLTHYWQRRRYLWLTKMALREGGAWVKVLGQGTWRGWRR